MSESFIFVKMVNVVGRSFPSRAAFNGKSGPSHKSLKVLFRAAAAYGSLAAAEALPKPAHLDVGLGFLSSATR